jgi:anaerobic ribonucleoside-triphosphate reductase activating protein
MNYATIKTHDVANGPGVRVSLFVSGCTHHCKNCFNSETWDFHYGQLFTEETVNQILEALKPNYIKGLSLLGGEPFEYVNQLGLLPLVRKVRFLYPEKNIWCYTGYDYEKDIKCDMMNKWPATKELLSMIDVLVDGEFVEELKDLKLRFRGSSNQRIIDVKRSLSTGEVILWEDQGLH